MKDTRRSDEPPSFQQLADACILAAQATVMGVIPPLRDGRLEARRDELKQALDAAYPQHSPIQVFWRFRDACAALRVAYIERDETYDWRADYANWTLQEQRWAVDPRLFDKETDVGWFKMHLLEMYVDEACPGQRNFDPDRFYELPPEDLKEFDWQRSERLKSASHADSQPVEKTEAAAATPPSRHDPAGSMVVMEDDPKWHKAQALVNDRLAEAFRKYELGSKPLPKIP